MKPQIFSEIAPLEKVFVYSPGDEHNLVLPSDIQPFFSKNNQIIENEEFLLFDDIIDLKLAKKQHQIFRDIINFYKEDSCIDLRLDLMEISQKINIKNQYPLINLMYTRDIAVIVGKSILLTKSSSIVRSEENILADYLFKNHPLFKDCNIIDFKEIGKGLSLEGGDIFVLNERIVLIGISERTSKEAINILIPYLFDAGFDYVVAIDLPKKRAMMHLDTIFTQISKNEAILFDQNDSFKNLNVYFSSKNDNQKKLNKYDLGIISLLKKLDPAINLTGILCGGGDKIFQLREQLTDGANSFALEPGKIIMYSCNDRTIQELVENDYKHITSQLFERDILTFEKILRSDSKVVISIDASELVKGRGGPRCMTLPVRRGIL
tara:strand:+ start:2797 stop:3933 length:1137 start_codon:yes stop_codon:yes gene_type:complete